MSRYQPESKEPVCVANLILHAGQQFAEISLFLQIASILGTYRISPYINEDGKEILPVREYINGIVAHPVPFQVKISPRSEAALSALYKDS